MAELDAMKELVEQLKKQAEYASSNSNAPATFVGASNSDSDAVIAELQAKLEAKQSNLATGLSNSEEEERKVSTIYIPRMLFSLKNLDTVG